MPLSKSFDIIRQFASQAPFAIWITDCRGKVIFANDRIYDLFSIPRDPDGTLGVNLLESPALGPLGQKENFERLKRGEPVDTVIDVPDMTKIGTNSVMRRSERLVMRLLAYALKSSSGAFEHFVLVVNDVTEMYKAKERMQDEMKFIEVFKNSRAARLAKFNELKAEIARVEGEIRALGAKPAA